MKIIYLPLQNKAIFSEEATEAFFEGKLSVKVVDQDGKNIPAAILCCGSRIIISGVKDGMYDGAVHEGAHPLTVEVKGKLYHVGIIHRSGNRVTFRNDNNYAVSVDAAITAEKALAKVLDFDKRIKKLEIASNGVDLLNLN